MAKVFAFDKKSIFTTEEHPVFAILPVSSAGRNLSIYEYISAANDVL